jgi:hypothetical protein
MHQDVHSSFASQRLRNSKQRDYHASLINFDLGDYVLHAAVQTKHDSKLSVIWRGPYKITAVTGDYRFTLCHFITNATLEAHASRLKFFSAPDLHISAVLWDSIETQSATLFEIDTIVSHRFDKESLRYSFLLRWQGFSSLEDSWEPIEHVLSFAPLLVQAYVSKLPASSDKLHIQSFLSSYL